MRFTPAPWMKEWLTVYALNERGTNRFRASLDHGHIPGYDSDEIQENNAILIQKAPEM